MNSSIYQAFADIVDTYATANSISVAWPGVVFTPPTTGNWLEVAWFPNETTNYGVGYSGPSQLHGFGQVSCCERPGVGVVSSLALADAMIALFAKGTALDIAQVERQAWASSTLQADDRISVPVTVRYIGTS